MATKKKTSTSLKEKQEDKVKFCLVKTPYWDGPSWVEDLNSRYWKNQYGGHNPKSEGDIVYETVYAEHEGELDWKKTDLLQTDPNKYEYGWLSPNAEFYGCNRCGHTEIAEFLLKSKEDDLMKFGWCRLNGRDEKLFANKTLTVYQVKWLNKNGFGDCISDYMLED